MFQGVQAVALQMAQEFGFTREIEDRVQAPCPDLAGRAVQGPLRRRPGPDLGRDRPVRSPRSSTPPASRPTLVLTGGSSSPWSRWRASPWRRSGWCSAPSFEPRNIGLMFGFVVLPITFLGGTYYQWTRLAPVKVGGWHWLQTVVLDQPAHLRERGDAGRLHRRLAHAPLRHLPRPFGLRSTVLDDRAAQFLPPRAVLTRRGGGEASACRLRRRRPGASSIVGA